MTPQIRFFIVGAVVFVLLGLAFAFLAWLDKKLEWIDFGQWERDE